MPSNNDAAMSVLSSLIQACRANADRLGSAADACASTELRNLFARRAKECREAANKLLLEADRPHDRVAPASPKATAGSDLELTEACAQSEDETESCFASALEQGVLPEPVREVVQKQYEALRRHHRQIEELLEGMRSGPRNNDALAPDGRGDRAPS